ncbi:MAG: hypothetical protein AB8B95_12905 [Pseudohongiellaceae bacterium]
MKSVLFPVNFFSNLSCIAVAVCTILIYPSQSFGQSNYAAFELKRENNWDSLATEDMDGDGLKDLIYSHYDITRGRELHILKQRIDGTFSSQPQIIDIKTEIIGIGFADLRTDPGMELLLFANSGVFSLSANTEGYSNNLKPLLQWELAATIPNSEQVVFFNPSQDINKDGHVDLLLPGRDSYGFFTGGPNETFTLQSQFSPISLDQSSNTLRRSGVDANIGINAEQGVSLEFAVESNSFFSDFIENFDDANGKPEALLMTENWLPNALLLTMNDDELLDIVYLNQGVDGLGQLNVHYQTLGSGFKNEPDWTGSLDVRGELQLADVNGDQRIDLVRIKGDGNSWNANFYVNENGEFNFSSPSQIMRFTGYDLRLNFLRLTPNAKPILSANYYTIPVIDAIRNASLTRTQLLFNYSDDASTELFSRRPDAKIDETFSAANVRGLSEQLSLKYDVNGDNRVDALYITENGTIAAKAVEENLTIAAEPFWEYIATNTVFEFEVLNLNEDSQPDLILKHGNSTTVLVALP